MNGVVQAKGLSMHRCRIPAVVNQMSNHNTPGQIRKTDVMRLGLPHYPERGLVLSVSSETVIEQ